MWTTKITEIIKNTLTFNFTVEFYLDGTLYQTHLFENVSEPEHIKKLVIDQLNQYKKIVNLDVDKLKGDLDLNPTPPPTPPAPTAEEIEARTLAQEVQKLNQFKKAINAGIITATNPAYVATLASVKAKYKESLINVI